MVKNNENWEGKLIYSETVKNYEKWEEKLNHQ